MMTQHQNQMPSPLPLNAEHAVLNALAGADDERLWRLIRSMPDEDQALRAVAEEAPRLMRRRHHGSLFSELFLVPVIERSIGEVVGNRLNWQNAEICISESLRAWLGGRVDQIVFRGVTPYEVICAWEPSTFREHLLTVAAGPSRRAITVHPAPVLLPEGAPRLGFIVLAVNDRRGWPQLPTPDTLRDARFRAVLGNALSPGAGTDSVQVLAPDQVSAALADGLCLWLTMLHATLPIVGWDMSPCATRHDAVKVTLNFAEEGGGQFSLRRHQLAPVGLDCIALSLASLAPRIGSMQVQ